jgi:hypothetical protein
MSGNSLKPLDNIVRRTIWVMHPSWIVPDP